MKTIEITLYSFNELSEEAKETAIEDYRHRNAGHESEWIYSDAKKSIDEFLKIFPVETYHYSWLEPSFSKTDDYILEMRGLRLRTWFINNSWQWITKRKYLKHFDEHKIGLNLPFFRKNIDYKNGNKSCFVYSRIQREKSCPLTGVCYDYDLLRPLYEFIEFKNPYRMHDYDFEDVMRDCFASLKKALEDEEEYLNSDEYISERLTEEDYDFTEDGKVYR